MVKIAWNLGSDCGILAVPGSKKGKPLPEEVIQKVQKIFENDEFSRMCPEKKIICINENAIRKQKKILLLWNLKELYTACKT